jgi:hypothetical protein
MRKILFVTSAISLILSISVSSGCAPCRIFLAPIHDVEIWANNSSPTQYFVDVVSGEDMTCVHFYSYNVTHTSNTTIRVEILNRECPSEGCGEVYTEVENTIPIGSDFIVGVTYTVEVNDVTEVFVPPIL